MTTFLDFILGPLLLAVSGFLVAWAAKKSEQKQKHEDAKQRSYEQVVDGYDRLNQDLLTRISGLNKLVEGLDQRLQDHRDRIEALEKAADRQRGVIRRLVDYVESLLMVMRAHNIEPPPRPHELAEYWR